MKLQCQLRIGLKLEALGAGSFLILIDHERAGETDAVVAKSPFAVVTVSGAREWLSAEHEQITAAIEELLNLRPSLLGESGSIGKNQKMSGGRGEQIAQLIRSGRLRPRKKRRQLRRDGSGRVGCRETGLGEDDRSGRIVLC